MDSNLKQRVAAERIELIARLLVDQMDHVRSHDKDVAIALINDLSACFRVQCAGNHSVEMQKIMPGCSCCAKTHN